MGWGLNTPDFAKLLQPVPVVFLTFPSRPVFTTMMMPSLAFSV